MLFKPSTTAVRRRDEGGQSLLEFLLLLPVLVGLVVIMTRVNTAIQISIVNQQYARAQAILFLANNSASFPNLNQQSSLAAKKTNQMVVGVSDNNIVTDADEGSASDYVPRATAYRITRLSQSGGDETNQAEPASRSNVRIRNTVSLCTQPIVEKVGGQIVAVTGDQPELVDASGYLYCTSKVEPLGLIQ